VPIYGTAVGGDASGAWGEFYFNGETAGYAPRVPALVGVTNAFAVYISNDSMSPVFRPGKRVYVDPNRPATPGDWVLVELHAENGDRNGPALIKKLKRRTAKELFLNQLNPEKAQDIVIPMSRVKHIYRALDPYEWLGE
jgi:phage repressor protein C with HTH and peptisase S24 domain